MKSSNRDAIQSSFTRQAGGFESARMNFSRRDYLEHVASVVAPAADEAVLEVAAGTCACGRALAPAAKSVTCLDMTPAMLAAGRSKAAQEGLGNMSFVLGDAAELPFLDDSFDVVLSRLAFHHFPDVGRPFAEMCRVLRPGGRLVMIDLAASEEGLREVRDGIERLRDPSHVRCLSRQEMLGLYERGGLEVTCCEQTRMPTDLESWLDHTAASVPVCEEISSLMQRELAGGQRTGLAPYVEAGRVKFEQRWVLVVGRKLL